MPFHFDASLITLLDILLAWHLIKSHRANEDIKERNKILADKLTAQGLIMALMAKELNKGGAAIPIELLAPPDLPTE